jgi:hypothetical protein
MFNGELPGEVKSSVCGRTWGPGAMAYRCSDWYQPYLLLLRLCRRCCGCVRDTALTFLSLSLPLRVACAHQPNDNEQLRVRGLLQARRRSLSLRPACWHAVFD